MDSKHSQIEKEEFDHVEDPHATAAQHDYPDALRAMDQPPSIELLERARELILQDQGRPMGATFRANWRALVYTLPFLISCLGQGYDGGAAGITNTMPSFLMTFGTFDPVTKGLFIPSVWLGLWTAMTQLGVGIGSILCGYLLDRFGPRRTSFMSSVFMIGPVFLQAFSSSRGMLLAGKMLGGIPQGIFVVATANFISESNSVKMRAPMSALMAMSLIAGIVFGLTVGYERFLFFTSAWKSWKMVIILQLVFPVMTVSGLLFTIDSPVYLIKRGKTDAARKALRRLYGSQSLDIDARLADVQYTVAIEREMHSKLAAATWFDLFRDPIDRRRTLVACTIWIVYQCGGNAFTANGLYFLTQAGIQIDLVFKITISMLALSAVTNLFAGYALERFGRRACFVYANIFHMMVLVVIGGLGFVDYASSGGWALAIIVNLAISTQQLATGGPTYALVNEVSSVRLRAKTQGLALAVNALFGWAFTFVTPYIFQPDSANLGAKTGFIFAGLTAVGILWSYFYVPETVGRSAVEIDLLFLAKVSARKFADTDVKDLNLSGERDV